WQLEPLPLITPPPASPPGAATPGQATTPSLPAPPPDPPAGSVAPGGSVRAIGAIGATPPGDVKQSSGLSGEQNPKNPSNPTSGAADAAHDADSPSVVAAPEAAAGDCPVCRRPAEALGDSAYGPACARCGAIAVGVRVCVVDPGSGEQWT